MLHGVIKRRQMPARQIDHMDIIAHAGAVGGVVIAAEHAQARQQPRRHLRHIRHQVVRNAVRILADQPALMRADGVEIAQQAHGHIRRGMRRIGQNLLDHHLRPAVGVGRARGHALAERHGIVHAVNRRRGGEYDALHAVPPHGLEKLHRAGEVVVVVFNGLRHGFSHGLQAGEMNHRVGRVARKRRVQHMRVAQVALDERKIPSGNFADALQRFRSGIAEIIDDDHLVTRVEQFHARMAADIPRAAGDKNLHDALPFSSLSSPLYSFSLSAQDNIPRKNMEKCCISAQKHIYCRLWKKIRTSARLRRSGMTSRF